MKFFVIIVIVSLMNVSLMFAGSENEGKTGLAFLKVGVDARAAGMGEAYTAVANNAFAAYWNPSQLLASKESNVVFMHNAWLEGINGDYGALQLLMKKSSLAFHVYSFNVGEIQVRSIPSADPLETTGANYASLGLSYARQFSSSWDFGLTVKYLFEKIFFHTAGGYGWDFGLTYKGLGNNFTIAGVLQNLGAMGKLDQESTKLPKLFRAGAKYSFAKPLAGMKVLLAGDVVKPFEENLRFHFGAEVGLWKQLFIRGGLVNGYQSRNVSFGVGIKKTFFHIDYSYVPFTDDLGSGQRFSLYLAI